MNNLWKASPSSTSVSYTHLDVYKRQAGMPGSILPDHESLLLIFFVKKAAARKLLPGRQPLFFLRAELI